MSLHFFLRPAIASVLLWGAVTPAAISSEDEAPLTVLGLSIGQSAADILPALSKTDFKPAQKNARKGRSSSAKLKQFGYETATGDKVVFEIAARQGGFDAGLIIGLNYAPARPDEAIALERKLRAKLGKPLANFSLAGDSRLYVWERPAPQQSRDFGPLMSVSLETGDSPALKINQFSRADIVAGVKKQPSRFAAAPKRGARAPAAAFGPVD